MELEFRREFSHYGVIRFCLYVRGSDKEKEMLTKAWNRLKRNYDHVDGIKVDETTVIDWVSPTTKELERGAWRKIVAKDMGGYPKDVTKYHIDKLVDLLREAISKMKKEVVYVYTI